MVTRKDVAEYAGVSTAVVSRVVNNTGYVSKDKRDKVEEAIKVLGYRPNLIARGLKTNETRQLLFYAPDLANPFFIEVYQGMEDYAKNSGYTIVVSQHYDDDMILQRRFDGIILSNISVQQQKEVLKLRIPAVVASYSGEGHTIPSVAIDMENGAISAVDYLYKCGHRSIAFITYNLSKEEKRFIGYIRGLEEKGIPYDSRKVVVQSGKETVFELGYRAGARIVDEKLDVTAVFSFNDAMAIGAISAMGDKGINVPVDISFIGFDDIMQSRFTNPPLTTIKVPKYEQGMESARMLINKIQGNTAGATVLSTRLIVRRSVKTL